MKSIKLLWLLLAMSAAAFCGVDLGNVHTVYVLPMAHGLEQYLANTLTGEHVFVIVTDPKMADAVLTDHVDAGLQAKLDALLAPPQAETKDKDKDKDAGKDSDKDAPKGSIFDPANKIENPAETSSFSRTRGMVFLVGTRSRQVLWSSYDLPKENSSKELDRIASDIVSRLRKDMGLTAKK